MRFAFTEDQLLFRDAVRDMLKKECPPDVVRAAWESDSGRTNKVWAQLANMGVLGAAAPEAAGGLDMNPLDTVLLFEEFGRVALPEPVLEHMGVAIPILAASRPSPAGDAVLAAAVTGDATISIALSSTPHTLYADSATHLIAERDGDILLVEADDLRLTAQQSVDRSRRLSNVDFDAGAATVLATGPEAAVILARAFERAALCAAAQLTGLAATMIDMGVEYATTRKQFGKAIGTFQAVQHKLADAFLANQFARPVVYRGSYALTREEAVHTHVSMAKAYASNAAVKASESVLQVHGAIGYTTECDLHLFMKRAWALAHAFGNAKWHSNRIGNTVLGDGDGKVRL